nr:hypothetical protein [Tanacetum cinerariifolium]
VTGGDEVRDDGGGGVKWGDSWCGGDGGEGIKVAAMVLRLSHDGGDEVETRWWICGVSVIDMVVVAAG